jgi:hypothetical protein
MLLHPPTNRPLPGRKFVIGGRQRNTAGAPRTQSEQVDTLQRMEAHRQRHAAESGQLLPRSRRHTDITLTTPLAPSASDSEDSDSSSNRSLSWPARPGQINFGKQLSRRAQQMEGPKPIPFRAFVESLPATKPPPSAWTDKTQALVASKAPVPRSLNPKDTRSTKSHTPTSSTSSSSTTVLGSTKSHESISIANTKSRKINEGFELLPAGALEKEPAVKEFGLWPANSTLPKRSKKLRKRSASNASSQKSSVEGKRLSEESFRVPIF